MKHDGHQVVEAGSAEEALALIGSGAGQFDVVITDRAMPVVNGDELAMTLKRLHPEQRVIMVTGFGAVMRETPPGVDAILSKPVTLRELRETFSRLFPQPGSLTER